jgi:hypothetical protein
MFFLLCNCTKHEYTLARWCISLNICWECINLLVPTIKCHSPRFAPFSSRQSPSPRLQGQARLCYLPNPRPSRWSQATSAKGCHLWYIITSKMKRMVANTKDRQAYKPGCESTQIPTLSSLNCWGACRPPLPQFACSQQLLGEPRFDLQVLRSHPRWSSTQGNSPGSSNQLDCQSRSQGMLLHTPISFYGVRESNNS